MRSSTNRSGFTKKKWIWRSNDPRNHLKDVTIGNILTDGIYNDLRFIVGNRLMVLVEAQSTWSVNIVIRTLLYFAQVLKDYLDDIEADLYHSAVVAVPRPQGFQPAAGTLRVDEEGADGDHTHLQGWKRAEGIS